MHNRNPKAFVASFVASDNPARLVGAGIYHKGASDQYLQVHDAAALPSNGAIPDIVYKLGATSNFSFDYDVIGRKFSNGIVICISTTAGTLTIGSADMWIDVQVAGQVR